MFTYLLGAPSLLVELLVELVVPAAGLPALVTADLTPSTAFLTVVRTSLTAFCNGRCGFVPELRAGVLLCEPVAEFPFWVSTFSRGPWLDDSCSCTDDNWSCTACCTWYGCGRFPCGSDRSACVTS